MSWKEGGWTKDILRSRLMLQWRLSYSPSMHVLVLVYFHVVIKALNHPNKYLAYLNESVYPTYIVHMHVTIPMIVILAILGVDSFLQ